MMGDGLMIDSKSIDLPEFQGEPHDIAKRKVRTAYDVIQEPVFVEDTGLCFNALGGLPGPYIKWFLEKLGPVGLNKMLQGFDNKSAYAQCIFAYFDGKTMSEPILFDGRCPGQIVAPRGPQKFGWDPIFQPEGFNDTFAEMDAVSKQAVSHRGKAFRQFKEYILNRN